VLTSRGPFFIGIFAYFRSFVLISCLPEFAPPTPASVYVVLLVKAGSYQLSTKGINLDANYFCGKSMQTTKDATGGDFDGQVSVDPDRALEVKGNPRLADIVSLGLL